MKRLKTRSMWNKAVALIAKIEKKEIFSHLHREKLEGACLQKLFLSVSRTAVVSALNEGEERAEPQTELREPPGQRAEQSCSSPYQHAFPNNWTQNDPRIAQ